MTWKSQWRFPQKWSEHISSDHFWENSHWDFWIRRWFYENDLWIMIGRHLDASEFSHVYRFHRKIPSNLHANQSKRRTSNPLSAPNHLQWLDISTGTANWEWRGGCRLRNVHPTGTILCWSSRWLSLRDPTRLLVWHVPITLWEDSSLDFFVRVSILGKRFLVIGMNVWNVVESRWNRLTLPMFSAWST